MATHLDTDLPKLTLDCLLSEVLASFPQVKLAIVFGSMASGRQRADSDLDLAVLATHGLQLSERSSLIAALAARTGRAIDLIDLQHAHEPLLGQILRHGRRVLGSETLLGDLINHHLLERADFMPYRSRILAERRMAWIGM